MAIDFATVKRSVDLVDVAGRYTSLRRGNGPCPFCGGTDRFFIHKGNERCGCRQCEFNGDAIDLVSKCENVSKSEAAAILWGEAPPENQVRARKGEAVHKPKDLQMAWTNSAWQSEAKAAIGRASNAIQPPTSAGRNYLASRGLSGNTIKAFSLGFDPARYCPQSGFERPAILVPWLDVSGNVAAVQYRFIDTEIEPRYGQKRDSTRVLFGTHTRQGHRTLVACEGEMNAVSVWQAAGHAVDIVSTGPEKGDTTTKALVRFVALGGYQRVILWFDEQAARAKVFSVVRVVEGCSVQFAASSGKDANEVLVLAGEIGVRRVLGIDLPSLPEHGPARSREFHHRVRTVVETAHSFSGHCDPRIVAKFDDLMAKVVPGAAITAEDTRTAGELAKIIRATHDDPKHPHRILEGPVLAAVVRDVFSEVTLWRASA